VGHSRKPGFARCRDSGEVGLELLDDPREVTEVVKDEHPFIQHRAEKDAPFWPEIVRQRESVRVLEVPVGLVDGVAVHGSLTGPHEVRNGTLHIGGPSVVVRQDFRELVESVAEQVLEGGGDPAVKTSALRSHQPRVGDLLGEDVLEQVLAFRLGCILPHQIGSDEPAERTIELGVAGHLAHHSIEELTPHHRGIHQDASAVFVAAGSGPRPAAGPLGRPAAEPSPRTGGGPAPPRASSAQQLSTARCRS
jgi:hypothetical protein